MPDSAVELFKRATLALEHKEHWPDGLDSDEATPVEGCDLAQLRPTELDVSLHQSLTARPRDSQWLTSTLLKMNLNLLLGPVSNKTVAIEVSPRNTTKA